MRLIDLVPDYQAAMQPKLSRTSVRSYVSLTRTYLRTLPDDATEADLTEEAIRAYLAGLEAKHRRPATVGAHLAALRSFGAWLTKTERLAVNPAANIQAPKLGPPLRPIPTDEQLQKLLDAIDLIPQDYRRALARAVISMFVYSGLRRRELLALELDDIEATGLVHVRHGKGDKPRDVLLGPEALSALQSYLALRPAGDNKAVFLYRRNTALGDEGLRTLLRDLQRCRDRRAIAHFYPIR